MGINTLLPFLKEVTRETFIGRYKIKGKTAAVDASCWLRKALTVSVQRTGLSERYVLATEYRLISPIQPPSAFRNLVRFTFGFLNSFFHYDNSYLGICTGYLELLLRHGVKPFVVFDGFPFPQRSRLKRNVEGTTGETRRLHTKPMPSWHFWC